MGRCGVSPRGGAQIFNDEIPKFVKTRETYGMYLP